MAFFGPQFVKTRQTVPVRLHQSLHVGVVLVMPGQTQQLVPSMAIGSRATIVTMGGRLVGGGGGGRMVTLTGSESVDAPSSSVALARSGYVPSGALLQTSTYTLVGQGRMGQFVQVIVAFEQTILLPRPRLVLPAKNSTIVTDPSGSRAEEWIGVFTGGGNTDPLGGLMILTTGGKLVGGGGGGP